MTRRTFFSFEIVIRNSKRKKDLKSLFLVGHLLFVIVACSLTSIAENLSFVEYNTLKMYPKSFYTQIYMYKLSTS